MSKSFADFITEFSNHEVAVEALGALLAELNEILTADLNEEDRKVSAQLLYLLSGHLPSKPLLS